MPNAVWPENVRPDMKAAIIANRQFILEDFVKLFKNEVQPEKFLKLRATDDIVFEDPLERY